MIVDLAWKKQDYDLTKLFAKSEKELEFQAFPAKNRRKASIFTTFFKSNEISRKAAQN